MRRRKTGDPKPETRNSKQSLVITIDGPAGVGKSTVAKRLAQRLGLTYLDTGATYRALAYAAVTRHLNPITDSRRLGRLARRLPLRLRPAPHGDVRVLLDRLDITTQIRTEEVSEAAAQVSQYPEVRAAMVALQRTLANPRLARLASRPSAAVRGSDRHSQPSRRDGVIVEGRDTGSVVFPHATHKFFLDAEPTIRARRRQAELFQLYGTRSPLTQIREQLHFRDSLDRTRRVGPLITPRGAITIDTSHRSVAQVVRLLLRHISQHHHE